MPTPTQLDPRTIVLPCSRCGDRACSVTLAEVPAGVLDKARVVLYTLAALSGGVIDKPAVDMALSFAEHPASLPERYQLAFSRGAQLVCSVCLARETDAALEAVTS